MGKEEYLEFLNDMENNLKTVEGSKKNWNSQEILAILSLRLEIAKEKYRIKEWFKRRKSYERGTYRKSQG